MSLNIQTEQDFIEAFRAVASLFHVEADLSIRYVELTPIRRCWCPIEVLGGRHKKGFSHSLLNAAIRIGLTAHGLGTLFDDIVGAADRPNRLNDREARLRIAMLDAIDASKGEPC